MHVNKTNGKLYIGQTKKNINQRWLKGEGYKPCTHFYRAIQKYGWDNFEHIVLFENLEKEIANIVEEELIKKYHTTDKNFGYNLRSGGENYLHSEESKKRMSEVKIGMYIGEKNPNFGNKVSEKTRRIMSEHRKGKCTGNKNPMYGKPRTEEVKKKLRDANLGKKASEETRKKMSNIHKNKKTKRSQPILKINKNDFNVFERFEALFEIKNKYPDYDMSSIIKCCKHKIKSCYGYIWMYEKEYIGE